MKRVVAWVLVLFMLLLMPIKVSALETIAPFMENEDISGTVIIDGDGGGTSPKYVTDAEGNTVTDEDGNPVTEAPAKDGEGIDIGTTAPFVEMDGQFSTRELSSDELRELDRIKKELEQEKKNQFSGIFGTVLNIVGAFICLYTFLILLFWLLDKVNFLGEIEFVRLITFNHAATLRDEEDKELVQGTNSKIYLLTHKTIVINTLVGVGAGLLLLNTDKLINIVQFVYSWLQTIFEGV